MERPPKIGLEIIPGIPEVRPGDPVPELIWQAAREHGVDFADGDILVIAHKLVSKAEGRLVDLDGVVPGERACALGKKLNKDPRKVEVVLRESTRVVRASRHAGQDEGVMICRHLLGFVSANACVDASNVPGEQTVALLPTDPDASARGIRRVIEQRTGKRTGVILSDTFGRPWRRGIVNVAVGLAGPPAIVDTTGSNDLFGRALRASSPALADELAAAAGLLMTKSGRTPAVLVKGVPWEESRDSGRTLVRDEREDLFL